MTRRKVAALLDALRIDARIVLASDPPEHAALYGALDQPVQLEFEALPLSDVFEALSESQKVPFRVLEFELAEEGVSLDEAVTYTSGERPLREMLNIILEDVAGVQLAYFVQDGAIQITTAIDVADRYVANIYDVSDILAAMPLAGGRPDYMSLADLLRVQTSGDWEDVDGVGGNIAELPGGRLAILTTYRVHEQITAILEGLRANLSAAAAARFDADAVETRYYKMSSTMAGDLRDVLPDLIAPETWRSDADPSAVGVIGIGAVVRPMGGQQGFFQMGDEVLFDETPLPPPPDVEASDLTIWLVITQTAGVHQQIAALLEELRTGIPASTPRREPRYWDAGTQGVLSEAIDP